MISAILYVTYMEPPKGREGLIVAVVPKFVNPTDWEKCMWNFFHLGFVQAELRLREQMVHNYKGYMGAKFAEGEAQESVIAALMERGALRFAGSITYGEGLCLWGGSPIQSEHPLERGALETFKLAYEVVTDWLRDERPGTSFDADFEMMEKRLATELAKLPVFPKVERKEKE